MMSSLHCDPNIYTCPLEMDWTGRGQSPSFGNWDNHNELPMMQYFHPAHQAGLHRRNFFVDDVDLDLFSVAPSPLPYHYQKPARVKTTDRKKIGNHHDRWDLKKQGRVCDENHRQQKEVEKEQQKQGRKRAPKAVDEDLYKIPPELLYQNSKRRVVFSDFWKRCLGLSCIP